MQQKYIQCNNMQNAEMDWTYNPKIAAVKLKHLSGLILYGGWEEVC